MVPSERFYAPFPELSGFGANPVPPLAEDTPLLLLSPSLPALALAPAPSRTNDDDDDKPSSAKLFIGFVFVIAALGGAVVVVVMLMGGGVIAVHSNSPPTPKPVVYVGTPAVNASNTLQQYMTNATTTPVDVYLGYMSNGPAPTPQLSTAGLTASSIPAQFTINQTGLFVPQGWGAKWTAALQRTTGPAELAIIGDAAAWQGALDIGLMKRLGATLGTGRIPLGSPSCGQYRGPYGTQPGFNTISGWASVSWSNGGPGATTYIVSQQGSVTCSSLHGTMLTVEYLSGPNILGFTVLVNGVIVTTLPNNATSTTTVGMYTYTSSSDITQVELYCPLSSTFTNRSVPCGGFGIKTWYPRQGVIVNNYASLSYTLTVNMGAASNHFFYNSPTITQWLGTTLASPSMNSANWVHGDLVLAWFQFGEAQMSCSNGSVHVTAVQSLLGTLANATTSDVLWFYGMFDGYYFNLQRTALKAYAVGSPLTSFAYIDMNIWFDNSPKLLNAMSGYIPCNSTNLASADNYCWDMALPQLTMLSDVGAATLADILMPLLNGTGYYNNTGTWPRYPPNTTWPIPIPQAYLNRPPIPYSSRMKKGVGVLPEGYHPILYTCDQILAAVNNTGWYFNWDTKEECFRQMLLLYQAGAIDATAFTEYPMFIPEWYDELSGWFSNQLLDMLNCPPSLCPILFTGNEPNLWHEGLYPPARAAQLWPLFEALGRNLGRPAPSQNSAACPASATMWTGTQWIIEWQRQCMIILGRPCQYDFGVAHAYHPTILTTLADTEATWSTVDGGRQMFLQEFGAAPWSTFWAGINASSQTLENCPHIYGYSWYALRSIACNTVDQNGNSNSATWCTQSLYPAVDQNDILVYFAGIGNPVLLDQPPATLALTSLGQSYATLPSTYPFNPLDTSGYTVLADPTQTSALVNYWPLAGSLTDATGNSGLQVVGGTGAVGFTLYAPLTLPDGTTGSPLCTSSHNKNQGVTVVNGSVRALSVNYTQCAWFWLSPSYTPSEVYLFGTANSYSSNAWELIDLVWSQNSLWIYRIVGSPAAILSWNGTLSLGAWHHLCVAYDDRRWLFQGTMDGVSMGQAQAQQQMLWSNLPRDNNFLGGFPNGYTNSLYGCLWHVRFYNQTLPVSNMVQLYTART